MPTIGSLVIEMRAETAAFRRELSAARGSVSSMERQLSNMGRVATRAVASLVTIEAAARVIRAVATATMEAEQSQARLEGVLRATGQQAGITAREIGRMADEMQSATLFDDEQVKNAAAALLTFQSIAGDTFRDVLALAGDLVSVFGGDLQSTTELLGKALERPAEGVAALRRAKITLTDAQERQIRSLMDENKLFDAQTVLLDAVRAKVGGLAEEMGQRGLTGATNELKDALNDLLESWGESRVSDFGRRVMGVATDWLRFVRRVVQPDQSVEDFAKELQEAAAAIGRTGLTAGQQAAQGSLAAENAAKRHTVAKKDEADAVRYFQSQVEQWAERNQDTLRDQIAAVTADGPILQAARERYDQDIALREAAAERAAEIEAELYDQSLAIDESVRRAREEMWQEEQAHKVRVWNNAVEDMQDAFASTWRDLLTGEVNSFAEFTKRLLGLWADMLAQMAAARMAQSLFGSLFQSTLTLPAGGPDPFPGLDLPLPSVASPSLASAAPSMSRTVVRNTNVTLSVNAVDGASAVAFIQQNRGAIAAEVLRATGGSRAAQRRLRRGET